MTPRTAIVGAGPAGLAGALWRIQDAPERDLEVFEAQDRPGGWVRTERREGFLCELGPQAIRPSAELDAIVEALDLGGELVPASATASARWIGRGGRLLPAPKGPGQFFSTRLLSLRGKLRLLAEPFVAKGDPTGESIAAFARRRFGPQTPPLVQAMISGIYAGDAERLEVESAFPMLAEAERRHGSVLKGLKARRRAAPRRRGPRPPALYSFRGGMESLVRKLAKALGERLHTGNPVRAITRCREGYELTLEDGSQRRAERLILACPARVSAALLGDLDPELAALLRGIPYASVASVYLGFPAADLPPTLQGFGFLLEPGEGSPVLGAIYGSSLFPDHAPAGQALVRVMLGGSCHPEAMEYDDDRLIALSVQALERYGGLRKSPGFCHVARVRDAIPQYDLGHAARLQQVQRALARHPGLSLRGNSYRAVALAGQLGRASGLDVARAVSIGPESATVGAC